MTRAHWTGLAIGVAVAGFGLWRVTGVLYYDATVPVLIALLMGAAAGLYRIAPGVAVALVWATGLLQVVRGLDIALVQLAAVLVAFGASRYGRTATVWISGLSIPLGAAAALLYAQSVGSAVISESGLWRLLDFFTSATDLGYTLGSLLVAGFVLATALLAAPWALGLVLRLRDQGRRAAEARERAQLEATRATELAELRERQATLARDVHDVVGHSLAVIVAQADSTRALPDDELGRIRAALANIAESARASLADVRHVLSDTAGTDAPSRQTDLDSLLDGVRAAGTEVRSTVTGHPRPLPPDLELVAYRTLQELLTNALKHGEPGRPLDARLHWTDDALGMTLRNEAAAAEPGEGSGIAGMTQRLAAVGGRFDHRFDDGVFEATAWMPLHRETT